MNESPRRMVRAFLSLCAWPPFLWAPGLIWDVQPQSRNPTSRRSAQPRLGSPSRDRVTWIGSDVFSPVLCWKSSCWTPRSSRGERSKREWNAAQL